jgi:hypothetical protein
MPIDLASVDWLYVVVLAVLVFVATLVGNILSFHHRIMASLLSAIVFAGLFVFWTYYPHNLPLPTTLSSQKAAPPAASIASPAPVAPAKPANPVTTVPTPR